MTLKFFIAKNKPEVTIDYDEWDSFLIVAHRLEEAKYILQQFMKGYQSTDTFDFKELNIEDYIGSEVILDSYNAG